MDHVVMSSSTDLMEHREKARGKVFVDTCDARGVVVVIRVGVGFRIRRHGARKTICCTTRTVHD